MENPTSLNSIKLCQVFFDWSSLSDSAQNSLKLYFLQLKVSFKPFSLLKIKLKGTERWLIAPSDVFWKALVRNLDSSTTLALTACWIAAGHYLHWSKIAIFHSENLQFLCSVMKAFYHFPPKQDNFFIVFTHY